MTLYDFATWSGGMPVGWSQYNDAIGADSNTVAVTNASGAALVCDSPSCGIVTTGTVGAGVYAANVNVTSGTCALVALNASGISSAFTHALAQDDFALTHTTGTSTWVDVRSRWMSVNGDEMALLEARKSTELSTEGAIYMTRNGGTPYMVIDNASKRDMPYPGVVWTGSKHVIVYRQLDTAGDQGFYAVDLDDDSDVLPATSRTLAYSAGYNLQPYSVIKHSNGSYYTFLTRFATPAVWTFAGAETRVYKSSDDLQTMSVVGNAIHVGPEDGWTRAFNEGYSVELSTGIIRTFWRNGNGAVYYTDFDTTTDTHSGPTSAGIMSSQAAPYALKLADSTFALVWMSCKGETGNAPRKVFAFAISDDDCATWKHHHIIATSAALGDSMTASQPTINQPYISENASGVLSVDYYRVQSTTTNVDAFIAASSDYECGPNISSGSGAQTLYCEAPAGSYLALVSAMGTAAFTATDVDYGVLATPDSDSINLSWPDLGTVTIERRVV